MEILDLEAPQTETETGWLSCNLWRKRN